MPSNAAPKQTVLITGCSKNGIGDALAQEFLRRGFLVFATARNLSKVQHLKELGCEAVSLDVTKLESIDAAVEVVREKTGGKLDFLVNNAGINYLSTVLDTDMDAFKQIFEVKVFGAMAVTKAFAPQLLKAKGTIVNIGSIATYFFAPIFGGYSGANSALEYLSHQMRMELSPFGVGVVHVNAGGVVSNLGSNRPIKLMPYESLYRPIEEEIEFMASDPNRLWGSMDSHVFARKLVSKVVTKKKPPMVHLGGGVWPAYLACFAAWCFSWLVGVRFWDIVVGSWYGMGGTRLEWAMKNKERLQVKKDFEEELRSIETVTIPHSRGVSSGTWRKST